MEIIRNYLDPAALWDALPDMVKTTVLVGGTVLLGTAVTVQVLCGRRTAAPVAVLEAELLAVSFVSDIKVAYNQESVLTPNWTQNNPFADVEGQIYGSRRPGVYLAGQDTTITINIRITRSEQVSATATLSGQYNGAEFRCTDCPTAVGDHAVQAQLVAPPDGIRRICGAFAWTLTPSDNSMVVHLAPTPLELFFILGRPLACYDSMGVWTEALRFLCQEGMLADIGTVREATVRITRYCHSEHKLVYDSANHYTYDTRGARFCLSAYLHRVDGFANCYDQAGAVTVLSHAIGSPVKYRYTQCYGFINPTNLMGVSPCNNPGYRDAHALEMIDRGSGTRTGFCDHAFCTLEDRVFDACVGPHCGDLTIEGYLAAAIDSSPDALELLRLGRENYPNQNATVDNIEDGGIQILDGGVAGQAIRRNLKEELGRQKIEELLVEWVLVFKDLTGQGNSAGDVPEFEQMLERQLVARMDREEGLSEHDAVAALDQEELRTLLLNHLNQKYDKDVDAEAHRQREGVLREGADRKAEEKDLKARIQQRDGRRMIVEEGMMTAKEFDANELKLGRQIYRYDPHTLELL